MKRNILLGITASIAAYKACDLIGIFRKKGHKVRCVLSACADRFITTLTLETLSGQKVVNSMFDLPEQRTPEHISLTEEADVFLIAPATADIIGKVAAGICDDILSATICSAAGPVIFAPAMNSRMYENPVVQDNIRYLAEKGHIFTGPVKGRLACGTEGMGHLAPLEDIVREVEKRLG